MSPVYIKTFTKRGIEYKVNRENGKAIVRAQSTAQGQFLVKGVYDINEGTWHNDQFLPKSVKEEVERYFK